MGQGLSAAGEEFQHVVEGSAVAHSRLHYRAYVLCDFPEVGGFEQGFPCLYPKPVSSYGVDFPVVAHHSERLGKAPGREGVGGETGVHQGDCTGEIRVGEVRKIFPELEGTEHTFIHHSPGGEAGEIAGALVSYFRCGYPLFNFLAGEVKLVLEYAVVVAAHYEQLTDFRFGCGRHFPQNFTAHGYCAAVHYGKALIVKAFIYDFGEFGIVFRGFGQKYHSHPVASFLRHRDAVEQYEFVGYLHEDSGTVSGLVVSSFSPAMGHILQHAQRFEDNVVIFASVDIDHQANSAGIVFIFRAIQSVGLQSADFVHRQIIKTLLLFRASALLILQIYKLSEKNQFLGCKNAKKTASGP